MNLKFTTVRIHSSALLQYRTSTYQKKRAENSSFGFELNEINILHSIVGTQLGGVASFTSGLVLMAGRPPQDPLDKGKGKIEWVEEKSQPPSLYQGSEDKREEMTFGTPEPYNPDRDFDGPTDPQLENAMLDLDEVELYQQLRLRQNEFEGVFLMLHLPRGCHPSQGSTYSPNNQKDMEEEDFVSPPGKNENSRNPSGALSFVSSSISNCIRDHDIDQIRNECVTHIQNLWACSFALSINVLLRRGLPTLLKKFPEGSPFAIQYPRLYRWLQNLCDTVQKNGDTVMLVFSAYIAFSAFLLWANVWSLVNIAKKTYDFYKKYKKNNPNA